MKDLNYQLMKLCKANRDGSYATQATRRRILDLIANQLRELGAKTAPLALEPVGAEVYVDGKRLRGTPTQVELPVDRLPAIEFELDGADVGEVGELGTAVERHDQPVEDAERPFFEGKAQEEERALHQELRQGPQGKLGRLDRVVLPADGPIVAPECAPISLVGGGEKLERRAALGELSARARIDTLLDPGSFRELGTLVEDLPGLVELVHLLVRARLGAQRPLIPRIAFEEPVGLSNRLGPLTALALVATYHHGQFLSADAFIAFMGMDIRVVDELGAPVGPDVRGELVCAEPFPSMPLGFWNDTDNTRYDAAYFDRFPGLWHQGDYAEWTEHGGVVIHGRSDATLNPGGVRIGTANALQLRRERRITGLVPHLEHDRGPESLHRVLELDLDFVLDHGCTSVRMRSG